MKPYALDFVKRADMTLFSLCMICSLFGLVVIASATASYDGGSFKYVVVQLLALIIGIVLFVLLTVLDPDVIADKWVILIIVCVGLLLALIPFGEDDGTGNKSWIRFLGIGIQPSEIVKIIYIVLMAKHISYLKEYKNLNHILSVGQVAAHFLLFFGLIIVISGDLGSALVFFFIFAVMMYFAGLRLYWFVLGIAAVAALIPFAWEHFLADYQKARILAPYDPSVDPTGDGYLWQTNQSKTALASGRFWGTGLGKGPQTQNPYSNPAKHTDFIFSVIGEELGMFGCLIVFCLLMAIIIRCTYIGLTSKNLMSSLICLGVAGTILFQTLQNIGMCTGLTPVIGLTLPFFSYGGSSMFSLFAAVGLVSGVKYRPKPERFYHYR
ncbi:MAG: rod shape-determining protein RodA [Oscillospiraceae bacterium]|nr:rod shape-determining protein RodA [Oscillospiraceae bacterium]